MTDGELDLFEGALCKANNMEKPYTVEEELELLKNEEASCEEAGTRGMGEPCEAEESGACGAAGLRGAASDKGGASGVGMASDVGVVSDTGAASEVSATIKRAVSGAEAASGGVEPRIVLGVPGSAFGPRCKEDRNAKESGEARASAGAASGNDAVSVGEATSDEVESDMHLESGVLSENGTAGPRGVVSEAGVAKVASTENAAASSEEKVSKIGAASCEGAAGPRRATLDVADSGEGASSDFTPVGLLQGPSGFIQKACLSIAKNRNGPTGDINLVFIPDYMRFKER